MNTTHDDAATWRDLTDQLTPKQIAEMEYCEREGIPPGLTGPQHQLNCARMMARENMTQALCADIPTPPDAVQVYAGEEWSGDRQGRMFVVATHTVDGVTVEIVGIQFSDGTVERHILTSGDGLEQMTAAQARQLAALLVEAADELDRLND